MDKDERKEYNKNYYRKTKNSRLVKVMCDCGLKVCKASLKGHIKTTKHKYNKMKKLMEEKI